MRWCKVKYVNYLPDFEGIQNLIISAIVEFGVGEDSVSQTAFSKEIDLITSTDLSGPFIPLEDVDAAAALTIVEAALGADQMELLKMKAEMFFIQTNSKFLDM